MAEIETIRLSPCAHCEEPTDQEPQEFDGIEQIICYDCSDEFEYCNFCDIHHHNEDICRHLFWSSQGGDWGGCGSDRSSWDWHKESFHKVLDRVGVEPAKRLLEALRNHRYWHQFNGTIFGYDSLTAEWGTAEWGHEDFGHLLMERLTDQEEEAMSIGVQWLVSLWAGTSPNGDDLGLPKTPEADEFTALWIQEWLDS